MGNQKVIVEKLSLNKIKLGKNSRLSVSEEELSGLMQSIKEVGLLQPIGVVKNGTGYEICYGNRRFMACSRLGFTHIPVILHEKKKESDIDLKNLTENVQRRQISLAEAGRYMELLVKEGLSRAEISVRLGVSKGYVDNCIAAIREVPKEYRDDLDIKVEKGNKTKRTPGKISVRAAMAILSARKSFRLDNEQAKLLFKAAKGEDSFDASNVKKYASAIKSGEKDFINTVPKIRTVNVNFSITDKDYRELYEKHIENGPFRSLSGLAQAVLRQEKNVKFNIIRSF